MFKISSAIVNKFLKRARAEKNAVKEITNKNIADKSTVLGQISSVDIKKSKIFSYREIASIIKILNVNKLKIIFFISEESVICQGSDITCANFDKSNLEEKDEKNSKELQSENYKVD
jgi:hypothetical protein